MNRGREEPLRPRSFDPCTRIDHGPPPIANNPHDSYTGYMPSKENVKRLRPGVHNIASVQQLLGSPSSVTRFRHRSWLYVAQRSEVKAFLAPRVINRRILELVFDEKGILRDIKRYDLKNGKQLEIVEDVTPTRGTEFSILQQLLGNLGRFSETGE